MYRHRCKRLLCYGLSTLFLTGGLQARTFAAIVDTPQLASQVQSQHLAQEQRSRLQDLLSRADVEKQLVTMGVDPANALDRVANLSDAEVSALVGKLDSLPAGSGALGTIALVLLILILLDVAGVTDIFPNI